MQLEMERISVTYYENAVAELYVLNFNGIEMLGFVNFLKDKRHVWQSIYFSVLCNVTRVRSCSN